MSTATPVKARKAPDPVDINPFYNDDYRKDPMPYFREALANQPVVRHDQYFSKPVSIFRYADVQAALKDWETFSSQIVRSEEEKNMALGKLFDNFVYNDPPRHTAQRRVAQQAFLPTVIKKFEPMTQALAKERVDAALAQGEIDVVEEFASKITTGLITTVLGLPPEDSNMIRQWTLTLGKNNEAPNFVYEPEEERFANTAEIMDNLTGYFADYIAERKRKPKEGDIVSALMESEFEGVRFTAQEIESTCIALLVAGNDTTTSLISNMVRYLAMYPEQADLVRADLGLVPKALEETVRISPSLQVLGRLATRDLTLHGVEIKKNDPVLLWLMSANRDPDRFERPDEFDVTRWPNRHLGFGGGIHACIGAPLARMEVTTIAREVLSRTSKLELVGEPVLNENTTINCMKSQIVRFTARYQDTTHKRKM